MIGIDFEQQPCDQLPDKVTFAAHIVFLLQLIQRIAVSHRHIAHRELDVAFGVPAHQGLEDHVRMLPIAAELEIVYQHDYGHRQYALRFGGDVAAACPRTGDVPASRHPFSIVGIACSARASQDVYVQQQSIELLPLVHAPVAG